jgi:hypothetical protein
MKRVLCALAIGAAAFAVTPAHASETPVQVIVTNNDGAVGVGVMYRFNGSRWYPVGGAYVNKQTGEVCFGLSYQTGTCTGDLVGPQG